MTGCDLFREIGNISEEYITEAEVYQAKSVHGRYGEGKTVADIRCLWQTKVVQNAGLRKNLSIAACLILCIGLVNAVWHIGFRGEDAASSEKKEAAVEQYVVAESSVATVREEETCMEAAAPENAMVEEKEEEAPAATKKESEAGGGVQEEQEGMSELEDNTMSKVNEEVLAQKYAVEWDINEVREHQAGYPETYADILACEDCYIVVHGEVKAGQIYWEAFLDRAKAGQSAWVDIVQFTVEGDPIIETIHFDGENYWICTDYSRDAFRGNGEAFYEESFAFLQKVERSCEDGSTSAEYLLTDSQEDIGAVLLTGDADKINQLEYYSILYVNGE